jgi:hypothetical protein
VFVSQEQELFDGFCQHRLCPNVTALVNALKAHPHKVILQEKSGQVLPSLTPV